jgi:hypothetical protein
MLNISKITVKHFLNTALESREGTGRYDEYGIEIEEAPTYPLYLKIIFMRKTTQMKSILPEYNAYRTMEEVQKEFGDKLVAELRMVEDVIRREYVKLGDKFELKGLAQKCNAYLQSLDRLIFCQYVWDDFFKVVARTDTPHKRLLLTLVPKTNLISHYHAALKLLDNKQELLEMEEQFKNYEIIEKCLGTRRDVRRPTLFDWAFGKYRDMFSYNALKNGISFNKVSELVGIIDRLVAMQVDKF